MLFRSKDAAKGAGGARDYAAEYLAIEDPKEAAKFYETHKDKILR